MSASTRRSTKIEKAASKSSWVLARTISTVPPKTPAASSALFNVTSKDYSDDSSPEPYCARYQIVQQLQSLRKHNAIKRGDPGDISAGPI